MAQNTHLFQKISAHYDKHYNSEINIKWDTTDFYPMST